MADLPEHLYFYPTTAKALKLSTVFPGDVHATALEGPFTQPQDRPHERKVPARCLAHQCGSIERAYITIPAQLHPNSLRSLTNFYVAQGFTPIAHNAFFLDFERHGDEAKVYWNTSEAGGELLFSFFGFRGAPERLYHSIDAPELEQRLAAALSANSRRIEALTERGYGYVQMPAGITRVLPEHIVF